VSVSDQTAGQVERNLSQRVQALYRQQLGHSPGRIICQLFEKKVAIVIDNSMTQPEQFLAQDGQEQLANEMRTQIDQALRPQLRTLVEDVLGIPVLDIMSDATLDTERTGIIIVLEDAPQVRNNQAIPKVKASPQSS
jgi:uncharacterized protein YbcI